MKYIKMFLLLFCIFCPIHVFASTNTMLRTEENLLVPFDVIVNDTNRADVLNTPAVASSEKVYDFADLLKYEEENAVYNRLMNYINLTQIDAVIVTVKDLKGFTIDDYTTNFYRYNDFGKMGIIFAICTSDEYSGIYMKVFGNDERINSIYDNTRKTQLLSVANNYFAKKDYYNTIESYLNSITGFYNSNGIGIYKVLEDGSILKMMPWTEILILTFSFTFIIVLIFLYRILHKTSLKHIDDLGEKIDQGSLRIVLEKEKDLGIYNLRKK